ncbi:MAG: hypothetical protein ACXQTT_00940, partial [Candidatus Syntropharchaeia archaeon]
MDYNRFVINTTKPFKIKFEGDPDKRYALTLIKIKGGKEIGNQTVRFKGKFLLPPPDGMNFLQTGPPRMIRKDSMTMVARCSVHV